MRKNPFISFLLFVFWGFASSILAQENSAEVVNNIHYECTYGDWHGATDEHLPTMVKTFYYDHQNRLVRSMNARYQLGDSETTLEIEYEGQLKPETYTIYEYNSQGLLSVVSERKYRSTNGFYYQWDDAKQVQSYEYDEAARLIKKKSFADGEFTYTWKEGLLTEETHITSSGTWDYTKRYSNFLDGLSDCPLNVFQTGKYQNYIIENEYDVHHRLVLSTYYKIINAVKDSLGNVVSADKGAYYMQDSWEYDGDLMCRYIKSYWNTSSQEFIPSTKQEFHFDEKEGGVVENVYNYYNGSWYVFGSPKVSVRADYSLSPVVNTLALEEIPGQANSVRLSFKVPDEMPANIYWNIYRNGMLIGRPICSNGEVTYDDCEVPNGAWDYFVVPDTINYPGEKAISNIVSKTFQTELPAVTHIHCIESGQTVIDGNPVYAYNLVWNAPNTPYKILGYQVYLNPKEGVNHPTAHHVGLIKEPRYQLWESLFDSRKNTVVVEAVYNIGQVKSAAVEFTMDTRNYISDDKKIQRKQTNVFGDVMDEVNSGRPQKIHSYFYDNQNNLIRSLELGYLLGDDPDTEMVETDSMSLPISYTIYDYDEENRLTQVRSRKFGMYSGYDKVWSESFTVNETYLYDEVSGKLIEKNDMQKKYTYQWSGNRKISEMVFSAKTGEALYQITYADFNSNHQPMFAFSASRHPSITSYNRIYEYQYDENGNMLVKREFKLGNNVQKDENGFITDADKGVLNIEELWTYENGQLVEYLQNKYNSFNKELMPYSKRVYTVTASGVLEESFTYSSVSGKEGWVKSSISNEIVSSEYYGSTAPTNLIAAISEDKVNTICLTCEAPLSQYVDSVVYEVYRNGEKIGVASMEDDGKIVYEDEWVHNGIWDYFVKVSSPFDGVEFCVSNVVEIELNTELKPVEKVEFPVNGKTSEGNFMLEVTWEAPHTDMDILGYNVYCDIKNVTDNPSPDNGMVYLQPDNKRYIYQWSDLLDDEKRICVETVYSIGKVKSKEFPVTILSTPTDINSVALDEFDVDCLGNYISVNDESMILTVYDVNGKVVGNYKGQQVIDTKSWVRGIYLMKFTNNSCQKIVKLVR